MSFAGRLFVLAALFFCVAGIAAEEGQGETKESSSLINRIRRNHQEDAATSRFGNNFLLVRSPDGRGSAFLTRLWDQPVIVTNAHVYLEMKNPEIVDINGKVFKIKEVLGSKSRDLVILSYEGADPKAEMLETTDDVAAIPLSTPVTAYGNSLGDDVIVTQSGKLLGIGPDKIETDAPFVGGNSGGPVLTAKDEKVVGVATYLRHIRPNPTTTGSKYESSQLTKVVRRFATRIDNLSPDDLEPLKLAELDRERDLVNASNDWVKQIEKTFDEQLTIERLQAFRKECFKRARLLIEGETIEWHSNYLKNKFATNREMISAVLTMLKLDAVVELSRLGAILDRNAAKLTPAKTTGTQVRCFFCMGSGKYSKKVPNPLYKPNSACARYIIQTKACPICDGNGKRPLWTERFCFAVPPEVANQIGEHIEVCPETFCGFQLGGKKSDEANRYVFYRKQPLFTVPYAFGETLVYEGNHQDRAAVCTCLTFMFDRLLGVMILSPYPEGGLPEGLERYHQGEVSKASPMFIEAQRVRDGGTIPFDLRGRPLLKPLRPVNMEDDPRYDGMWVTGSHSTLGVIAGMDLPALAERCRESKK